MTTERAKELLPIITAFVEGEVIQIKLFDRLVEHPWEDYTGGNANFFNDQWEWRIKPEAKLRPFTQVEAAAFRWFRRDEKSAWFSARMISSKGITTDEYGESSFNTYSTSFELLLDGSWQCSIDGVTWQRCGVEVTE